MFPLLLIISITLSYIQKLSILSYPILSSPVLSYPILPYPTLAYPILSYPIYPFLSYPIYPSIHLSIHLSIDLVKTPAVKPCSVYIIDLLCSVGSKELSADRFVAPPYSNCTILLADLVKYRLSAVVSLLCYGDPN